MPEIRDHGQWVRSALQQETAEWTPQCPDPETLLEWLEQGDKHPEAKQLLAHLFSCAHCRQQRVALREIRALNAEKQLETARQLDPEILRALPARVVKWVRELIVEGMTSIGSRSVRSALDRLPNCTRAFARGSVAPFDIHPASTAIRSGRPTLRWSHGSPVSQYEVVILRPVGRNGFQPVWEGSTTSDQELNLPEGVELQPGRYQWQVVAVTENRKLPSELVGFVVLKEPIRQEIETLEREIESSPLARIGLYEAFGLYDDALQTAETLIQLNAEDETARRIHKQLLDRLAVASDPSSPSALLHSKGKVETWPAQAHEKPLK